MQKAEGSRQKKIGETTPSFVPQLLLILFAFCLLPSARSTAQVKGEVESIGFQNNYRPDCWTQMVIRLTPETDKAADYLVRIRQQDMDRDRPIFTRQITVTGTDENGNARDQRFRVYFKPQPTDGGLPDANATDGSQGLANLQKVLSVEVWSTGGKFIATLPITNTIMSLSNQQSRREKKFILVVTAGRSMAPHREYEQGVTVGMLEDVAMVPVDASELPENPIGYDSVDAILWLDASPDELTAGGDERLRALQNWVRGGGHLVICQQTVQWQKTLGFGDFLPVSINGVRTKENAEPLRSLARGNEQSDTATPADPWDFMSGPMTLAIAAPRPGAFVDEWITWPNQEITPYLARKSYGCGCVSWVAQDLGDRSLTFAMIRGERTETAHWPAIWNRIFDWKDDPLIGSRIGDRQKFQYTDNTQIVDIGRELNDKTMELENTGLWYISVAVIFFIAYWLVAGPGAFFFLLSKGRGGANWFVFAGTALIFTFLTVLLVDVVVRPADLRHFSLVRDTTAQAGAAPLAHVYSRFGLYIPRDGEQTLEIKDSAAGTAADLSAYAIPPAVLKDSAPNDLGPEYFVPITDTASGDSTVVRVPYRRTLKKLEASWTGDPSATGLSGGIEGTGKLVDATLVEGKLTNGTGRTLTDVYFAYRWRSPSVDHDVRDTDYLIYLPRWDAGVTLDLATDLRSETDHDGKSQPIPRVAADGANPDNGHKCHGTIQTNWEPFWLKNIAGNVTGDSTMELHRSLIVLSLFQRLMPDKRTDESSDRLDLLRRGSRRIDCSAALAAGSMVIVASEDIAGPSPIPIPLDVNGNRATGNGLRLYQFIVPMDNSFSTTPTTAPAD